MTDGKFTKREEAIIKRWVATGVRQGLSQQVEVMDGFFNRLEKHVPDRRLRVEIKRRVGMELFRPASKYLTGKDGISPPVLEATVRKLVADALNRARGS